MNQKSRGKSLLSAREQWVYRKNQNQLERQLQNADGAGLAGPTAGFSYLRILGNG